MLGHRPQIPHPLPWKVQVGSTVDPENTFCDLGFQIQELFAALITGAGVHCPQGQSALSYNVIYVKMNINPESVCTHTRQSYTDNTKEKAHIRLIK